MSMTAERLAGQARRWLVAAFALPVMAAAAQVRANPPAQPAVADAKRDTTALERAVDELAAFMKSQGGTLGAAIVDIESGALLAASAERTAYNPASNQKILTAAAALSRLGPGYRYTTGVYGAIDGGVARELVLRGHGDPSLQVADLWRLGRALAAMGLKRVDGDLLVDQSRFDENFIPPAFEQQPDEWSTFRAPVSAVAVERNTVTLHVLAQRAGQPAQSWFEPPGVVGVSGSVETRAAGSGQAVRLVLSSDGGRLRANIGGHVAASLPRVRFARRVEDPRLLPGAVLKQLLGQLGVEARGRVRLGGQSEKRRLTWVESAPLSSMLAELGKHSDNFYAEMIMKTLGAEAGPARGRPASSADGAEVIRGWLAQAGALEPDTRIVNGSGLFDANRVSALSLARALRAAYRDPAIASEFVAQLAVGGADGTLHGRFRQHGQTRIVRAKSGTLRDVVALSGYVLAPAGKAPIAFSLIATRASGNHPETRRRLDAVIDRIAAELWRS